MSENALVPVEVAPRVDLGVIRADRPAQLVQFATEAANALASVIESRKLYSNIQGKKFVKCEGWTTLAAMLGCTPHEIGVTEVEGVFTATVELRRLSDGQPVGRASAECGSPDETDRSGKPIWASRPRYARRSMALTRATAKACRLAFSWIMALSGYEVTPAEEIPHDQPARGSKAKPEPATVYRRDADPAPVSGPPTGPLTEKPRAIVAAQSEAMPWAAELKWKDKPLKDMTTDQLVALRSFCEKKDPKQYAPYLTAIEELLASRDGE